VVEDVPGGLGPGEGVGVVPTVDVGGDGCVDVSDAVKACRRGRLVGVVSPKKISTRLRYPMLRGVKYSVTRGLFASHPLTIGWLVGGRNCRRLSAAGPGGRPKRRH